MGRGLIYHGYGGQNTMDMGVKIPRVGNQYTTEKGLYITCVGASIYHGYWVQYTMGRGGHFFCVINNKKHYFLEDHPVSIPTRVGYN
jgi:hypothetical protein